MCALNSATVRLDGEHVGRNGGLAEPLARVKPAHQLDGAGGGPLGLPSALHLRIQHEIRDAGLALRSDERRQKCSSQFGLEVFTVFLLVII